MHYTYVLESLRLREKRYIGHTSDLKERLLAHNQGKCLATASFRPWRIKLYIAFEDLEHACQFERYLKSGSEHAFANRHFW